MHRIEVKHSRGSYDIIVDEGCLAVLPTLLKQRNIMAKMAVISDETVANLYGGKLACVLKKAGFDARTFSFPDGENSKNLKTVSKLYDSLIKNNFERDDVIIAFGGGVTGDIAGFTASSLFRGMRFVQIPTTLLAQVDSSVGGKTGVNHKSGKNLIGAFYQPELVVIDPGLLSTLQIRDMISGVGEVLKYALIADPKLFSWLEDSLNLFFAHRPAETIASCCGIKAGIVSKDELDRGCRITLNFGHTIGHALELSAGYGYFRHGEAVILGMIGASYISEKMGFLSAANFKRITDLVCRIEIPPIPKDLGVKDILLAAANDKKVKNAGQVFICLKKPGSTEIIRNISDKELNAGIAYLKDNYSG